MDKQQSTKHIYVIFRNVIDRARREDWAMPLNPS